MKTNDRTPYISYLNVISAVSVVILHANKAFWTYRADSSWFINNVVECVFYFAVPVFFMLTGATLLDYPFRYDTRTFFIKRIKKTLIPFLFWSFVPFGLSFILPQYYHVNTEISFENLYNGIVNTEFAQTYWFFIPLFCIYLIIPLFAFVQQKKKIRFFHIWL